MKFSVIVPIYNAEKYLNVCIDSVLRQSEKDFELILVNDGSTDSSFSICMEYKNKDDRVIVINKNNGGVVSARKSGAKAAKGDYVVCIDADDFVIDDYLLDISNIIEKNDYPDVIATGYQKVNDAGECVGIPTLNGCDARNYDGDSMELLQKEYLYSNRIGGFNYGCLIFSLWSKIVKRSVHVDNMLLVPESISYGDDLLATKLILDSIQSICVTEYAGYRYRDSATSMMTKSGLKAFLNYENTIKTLETFFCNDSNKICMYAAQSLLGCVKRLAKNSSSYRIFKQQLKETKKYTTFWSKAFQADAFLFDKNDSVKMFLLKNNMYLLIFFIFRR